jgi:hypothetical protein
MTTPEQAEAMADTEITNAKERLVRALNCPDNTSRLEVESIVDSIVKGTILKMTARQAQFEREGVKC